MGLDRDASLGDYYPLACRRLVGTLRVMGVPAARIADELGVAEGTVKSRLSRARSALATALAPLEVDDV